MTLLLTPKYHVIYNGVMHPPGMPFRIDQNDAARMRRHGDLQDEPEPLSENVPMQIDGSAKNAATAMRGRPRKNAKRLECRAVTDYEKTATLAVLVESDVSTNADALYAYIKMAGQKILNRCYPFGYQDGAEVPDRYSVLQCEIAAYMWNKRGAEGQMMHSENGVSRTYENGDIPESLMCQITPQGMVY